MERQSRGFIYILHHGQDELSEYIRERLNKKSYAVWMRDRETTGKNEREAHRIAVKKAFIVIVLETASLYQNDLSNELLREVATRGKYMPRRICVVVEPGDATATQRYWGPHITFIKPASNAALLKRIICGIKLEKSVVSIAPSKPTGYQRQYVFLSYGSRTSRLAAEVNETVKKMGMGVWDYGSSPRHSGMHFPDELAKKIKECQAVLIVFNAAWNRSDACDDEQKMARKSARRCIWLKSGRTDPPALKQDEVIDLRAHVRDQGFAILEKKLFPKRRRSHLVDQT